MKNILIVVVILVINCYKAQSTISMSNYSTKDLKNNNYIKDVDGLFNKFIGTWKYTNGSEEFTVKIVKQEQYNSFGKRNYYKDILFGGYKYVKNGTTIIDKLNFTYNNLSDYQNFAPFMGGQFSNNFQSLSLVGNDVVVGKWIYIDLEVIPNTNPIQMRWKITPRENIRLNNTLPKQGAGFGIPKDIILTKQ